MNQDFLIIDTHVHTYPTIEIGRQALGPKGYGYSGTIAELKRVMQESSISYAVMANFTPIQEMKEGQIAKLSAALKDEKREEAVLDIDRKMVARMERRNRWTCEVAKENPSLLALMSIDTLQSADLILREVDDKVRVLGAKGIKLHPMANAFDPSDRRLWPLYTRARELEIPVLFHTGTHSRPGYESKYGYLGRFEEVAMTFPELKIILAHLGKGSYEESVRVAKRCHNIFFDTSTCFSAPGCSTDETGAKVWEVIKKIGSHRIMFGTDWPWYDPIKDIAIIKAMGLSDEEKAAILGFTAKNVFKI